MTTRPPLLKLLGLAAFMALCLFVQPAWSVTIDVGDITNGTAHIRDDVDGFDIYANGGTFLSSSFNGWSGFFGVYHQNDAVMDEADVLGEGILITFDTPHVIDVIELGRLFAIGNFDDQVNERVEIIAQRPGASDLVGYLTVGDPIGGGSDLFEGTWTGSASLPTNLSPADESGAGVWQILDPFGGYAVTSLTFNPYRWPGVPSAGEATGQNSDFALLNITTTVPEPETAALLALGMVGLGFLGRRRP